MPNLLKPVLTGIIILAVLAALTHAFAEPLGRIMQQPIAWVTDILFPDFHVVRMQMVNRQGELVYEVTLQPHRAFMVGLNVMSDPRYLQGSITASTPMTRWFQQAILAFCLVLAWPGLPWRRRGLAVLTAAALLPLAILADPPFVLAGALDDMLRANFAPDTLAASWLRQWMRFMDGGGRLALGVGAGLGAVAFAGGLGPQAERKPTRNLAS